MGAFVRQGQAAVLLYNEIIGSNGLVLLHPLNEAAGSATLVDRCTATLGDSSAITGSPTLGVSGSLGDFVGATFAAGSDGITLNSNAAAALSFDQDSPFSVLALVNVVDFAADMGVIAKWDAGNTLGWYFKIDSANQAPHFGLFASSSHRIDVYSATALSAATTYMVGVTYDGSGAAAGVALYDSGSARSGTVVSDTLNATTVNAKSPQIGRLDTGGSMKGTAGFVAVWNRAISAVDMKRYALLAGVV